MARIGSILLHPSSSFPVSHSSFSSSFSPSFSSSFSLICSVQARSSFIRSLHWRGKNETDGLKVNKTREEERKEIEEMEEKNGRRLLKRRWRGEKTRKWGKKKLEKCPFSQRAENVIHYLMWRGSRNDSKDSFGKKAERELGRKRTRRKRRQIRRKGKKRKRNQKSESGIKVLGERSRYFQKVQMRRDLSKRWKGEEKILWEKFQAEEEAKNEGAKVSKTVKRVRSDGTRGMEKSGMMKIL